MDTIAILIILAIFIVAVLYSSVGHGGASGYLAMMAFLAVAPEVTRPTAFLLNVFVATIASIQFIRAGYFSWRLFWPFALGAVPVVFLAAFIHLPTTVYKIVFGVVLILAALRLAWNLKAGTEIKMPPIWLSIVIGMLIGLLSGLVGVGGGIFLTPVLLLMNWSETKKAAGVSAMFILVNSLAGIAGNYAQVIALQSSVWIWIAAAVVGGVFGSTLGAKKFDSLMMRRVLAVVLLFAGVKLIFV